MPEIAPALNRSAYFELEDSEVPESAGVGTLDEGVVGIDNAVDAESRVSGQRANRTRSISPPSEDKVEDAVDDGELSCMINALSLRRKIDPTMKEGRTNPRQPPSLLLPIVKLRVNALWPPESFTSANSSVPP